MTEDAKVLEDGPAFEPTKRLRGLAAVEDFVVSVAEAAMSGSRRDVSSRGKLYDHLQIERKTGKPLGDRLGLLRTMDTKNQKNFFRAESI